MPFVEVDSVLCLYAVTFNLDQQFFAYGISCRAVELQTKCLGVFLIKSNFAKFKVLQMLPGQLGDHVFYIGFGPLFLFLDYAFEF